MINFAESCGKDENSHGSSNLPKSNHQFFFQTTGTKLSTRQPYGRRENQNNTIRVNCSHHFCCRCPSKEKIVDHTTKMLATTSLLNGILRSMLLMAGQRSGWDNSQSRFLVPVNLSTKKSIMVTGVRILNSEDNLCRHRLCVAASQG